MLFPIPACTITPNSALTCKIRWSGLTIIWHYLWGNLGHIACSKVNILPTCNAGTSKENAVVRMASSGTWNALVMTWTPCYLSSCPLSIFGSSPSWRLTSKELFHLRGKRDNRPLLVQDMSAVRSHCSNDGNQRRVVIQPSLLGRTYLALSVPPWQALWRSLQSTSQVSFARNATIPIRLGMKCRIPGMRHLPLNLHCVLQSWFIMDVDPICSWCQKASSQSPFIIPSTVF